MLIPSALIGSTGFPAHDLDNADPAGCAGAAAFPWRALAMNRSTTLLLVVGAAILGAAYVGLAPLLRLIYPVQGGRTPAAVVGSGSYGPMEDSKRPHVVIWPRPLRAPKAGESVELQAAFADGYLRRDALMLRWLDGGFLWGTKRISFEDAVPYVNGLLKAKQTDVVWVYMEHDSHWGEVVSVADRLRGTTARVVYVSIEEPR